jgi:hypothetical protein
MEFTNEFTREVNLILLVTEPCFVNLMACLSSSNDSNVFLINVNHCVFDVTLSVYPHRAG